MKIEEFYYDIPFSVKEDVGFPLNYSFLSQTQKEFVDQVFYGLHSELKEDLSSVKDELENIIDRFEK